MTPSLKLVYFNLKGRAEIIRLCFASGKVPFEDKRITQEEFAALKPTLPFGQLPVLHVNNFVYPQSMAIVRCASTLAGIYPTDAFHLIKVELILGCYDELVAPIVEIMHSIPDEAAKAAKIKELLEDTCPKIFGYIQTLISGRFVLGDTISTADVAILSMLDHYLVEIKEFDASKYPEIQSVAENTKAYPNIAEYLSKNR